MKRSVVLGMLVALGALAAVKAQPPAVDPNAPKVIEVEKVKDNLYVLRSAATSPPGGGNTAVFVTANGVVVVDAKNPGWGTPILNKIKELTPKPVTTLINTHTHGDHVSGNVEVPATIDFVAQENTKTNMEKMPIVNGHMPKQTTFADLKEFADFNHDFLTWAEGELKAGKTPAQAATEWKLPEKYAGAGYAATVSALFGGLEGRLKTLQDEMKR